MSEEEDDEQQTIRHVIEKSEATEKAEAYDKLMNDLRDKLNAEFDTEEFNDCESIEDCHELAKEFEAEAQPPSKKSTGSVSLLPPPQESQIDDLLETEYEDPFTMIQALKKRQQDPNLTTQERQKLAKIENHLWSLEPKSRAKPVRIHVEEPMPPKDSEETMFMLCPHCNTYVPHSERISHIQSCKPEGKLR